MKSVATTDQLRSENGTGYKLQHFLRRVACLLPVCPIIYIQAAETAPEGSFFQNPRLWFLVMSNMLPVGARAKVTALFEATYQ